MNPSEIEEYNRAGSKLAKKAEDKLTGGFFKNMVSSKEERFEKALDCYKEALDNYKLAKNCGFKRDGMCVHQFGVRQDFAGNERRKRRFKLHLRGG